MTAPRVSIVTPCHDAERFVAAMIESVRAQTLQGWEHVVVDDGSPDRSAEVVAPYAALEPRLRLIRQANAGAVRARNRGYAACAASSEYVLFLDADDCLEPDMLAALTAYLDEHADVGMVYCEPTWIDADDREVPYGSPGTRYVPTRLGVRRLPPTDPDTPFVALFFWGRLSPSISLLRRSAYEAAGGWTEDQGYYGEDLDLFLKVALEARIHYLPRRLVRRRIHGGNHGRAAPVRRQEQRLYDRWLEADWLSPDQRRMVRDAWRLRQRQLLPYLWLSWGTGHLRRGHVGQAAVCYLRGVRRALSYASASARGLPPPGPVW